MFCKSIHQILNKYHLKTKNIQLYDTRTLTLALTVSLWERKKTQSVGVLKKEKKKSKATIITVEGESSLYNRIPIILNTYV